MLTAAQAAGTWCPMVRIARHETVAAERHFPGPGGSPVVIDQAQIVGGCNTDALGVNRVPASCRCIAAGCAMWRWAEPAPEPRDPVWWWCHDEESEAEPARPAEVPASAVWVPFRVNGDDPDGGYWCEADEDVAADHAKAAAARRGYCGLAGKPCA